MKVTSPETMARILHERLAAAGDPTRAVTLAQLLDDHLSYARVRPALDLAGKGEYDVAVLGLLADRTLLQVDPAVEAAARRELESPEPALAFAGPLAERLLRLRDAPSASGGSDPEGREEAAGPETEAAVAERGTVEPAGAPEAGVASSPEPEAALPPEPEAALPPEPEAALPPEPEAAPSLEPEAEASPEPAFDPATDPATGIPVACWSCASALPDRDVVRFCPRCGSDQEAARCTSCGDRLEADWAFCPRCGRPLDA